MYVYDFESSSIQIEGTASSGEITASKTEDGVMITGLNDVTITYYEDDVEISNTKASIKDGRTLTVTVDDNTNQVSTDYVNENTTDEPEKNICDYCGKTHSDTFIGMLIAFIHYILNLINDLFK